MFKLSQGVPRIINVICDRALLGAYSVESRRVTRQLVRRAAAEISGRRYVAPWLRWATPAIMGAGIVLLGIGAWSMLPMSTGDAPQVAATVANAEPVAALPEPAAEAPAAVAITVDEPEPEVSLDEQLSLASDLTSLDSALATLYAQWNLDYDRGTDGCVQAQQLGYECLRQRGSWNSLRQLDRPAILTLTDSRGDNHRAVLTAIHGDRAELSIAGVDVSHPIEQVSDLWFGEFLLIWKPANASSVALLPGMRDPNVIWLRQSLTAIDDRYRAEPLDSDLYDAGLEQQVRAFQRDHRLLVDGLAGRQTQIIINSLLAPDDVPRLTTPMLAQD